MHTMQTIDLPNPTLTEAPTNAASKESDKPQQQGSSIAETRLLNLTRLLRERFDGRQSNLARAIGRKPDYIWRVLNRQKGFGETIARDIEKILELPESWLDNPSNSTRTGAIPKAGSHVVLVPLFINALERTLDEVGLPRKTKSVLSEDESLPIKESVLYSNDVEQANARLVVMDDHSMSMTISQADHMLINTAATRPIDGRLFYVEHGGLKIRRLIKEAGGLWGIRCDTLDKLRYPDTTMPEHELRILGQVFWSAGQR